MTTENPQDEKNLVINPQLFPPPRNSRLLDQSQDSSPQDLNPQSPSQIQPINTSSEAARHSMRRYPHRE